jgi:ribosome-binding protein aMBF1 (putative translation factor)
MNPYKAAVLRVCVPVEQVPLNEPPVPEFDLGSDEAVICPQCGGMDAKVAEVEAAEVAHCPDCGCEFDMAVESLARTVISTINERRRQRRRALSAPAEREATEREMFRLLGV